MANSIGKVQIDFVAGLGQLTSGLAGISSQVGGLERNVKRSTQAMNSAFESVRASVAGVGLLALARQAVQAADSFAGINARLQLVTRTQQEYATAQAESFAIAQRTQSGLAETANLYGKLDSAVRSLGGSQEDALKLTETINQSFRVSGTSSANASAGVLQLSQALSSGVLRGDEFNSVLENAPRLAKALADGMRVPIGALRQLAEQGKLTSDIVVTALQSQSAAIAKEFAQIPLTVSGAFQQLKNSLTQFVGQTDSSIGVTRALAGSLELLATNISLIGNVALAALIGRLAATAAAFLGTSLAARSAAATLGIAIPTAAAAAGASLLKLIGGPFGLLIATVGLVSAAVEPLSELFESASESISDALFGVSKSADTTAASIAKIEDAQRRAASGNISLADFRKEYEALTPAVLKAAGALNDARRAVELLEAFKARADRRGQFFDVAALETARAKVGELQGQTRQLIQAQIDARRTTDEMSAAMERQKAAIAVAQSALGGLTTLTTRFAEEQKRVREEIIRAQSGDAAVREFQIQEEFAKSITAAFNESIPVLQRYGLALEAAWKAGGAKALNDELIKQESALKGLKSAEEARTKSARSQEKAQDELNREIENGIDVLGKYNKLLGLADSQSDELDAVIKAYKAGKISAENFNEVLREQEKAYLNASLEAEETARATTEFSQANKDALKPVTDLISSLENEEAILRAQLAGRTDLVAALLAEARVREVLAQIPDELRGQVDPDEVRRRLQVNEALKEQVQIVQSLRAAYADAFGDLAAGIGDIGDFFESLGDTTRRYFSDLISNAIKSGKSIKEIFADLNKNSIAQNGLNLQNAGNLIGSGFNAFQSFKEGDTAGTIISSAQFGSAIGGTTGAIIGAIIGGIASLFGGSKPPDLRLGGIGNTRKPEQTFTTALGSFQVGARGLEGKENEFVDLVKQFDASLSSIVGSFRDGQSQLGIVQAALQRFAIDLKGDAVTAENVLGARFGAILATFNADVQAFVGAAGTVEERVQRLADASFIDAAAAAGKLVDTFADLASIIKTQQVAGESAAQTYARVAGATALLESALDLTGANIELGRIAFVNLATDIVDAAGGLERASQLWNAYYETFYSDTERAVALQAAASRNLTDELADVGLGAGTTKEQFRALFESLLPTLTPEQIAQYLEAAEAFAQMDAALGDVTETVSELNAIAIATPEQLASALDAYRQFQQGIGEALEDLGATEFQRSLTAVRRELEENTRRANELAQAAGLAGATQEDLADIQLLASRRIEQAIAALRQRIATLANSLYGPLARITRQIAERQAEISASSSLELGAIQQVADASANRYEAELQALKQIAGFLDSLKLDTALTTLTPQQRVSEAQGQFERLLARARGGDTEALQQLSGAAQAYLREARGFFASGSQYTTIFDFVTQALAALGPTTTPGGIGTNIGGGGGQVDTQLAFLESERERLTRDQERAERQAQVLELIGFLRELSAATSTNILELAGSFEIPLAQLVTDLGVNLDELSASTAVTLAGIANQLGVELTDLAQSVGIDLGSLADDQSLLNDALEQVISGLPPLSAAALAPLLQAVEDATTEADANEAIEELTLAALAQPVAIRNQLAPFLDGLDLAGSLTDLDYLEQVAAKGLETAENTYTATLLLTEIRDLISSNPEPLTPIPIVPPEEPESVSASFAAGVTVLAGKLDKLAERVGGVEKAQDKTAQAVRLQTEEMTKRR